MPFSTKHSRSNITIGALAFFWALWWCRDFGVTFDELTHLLHGRKLINYYTSFGANRTSITTGDLYLYGGFFDFFLGIVDKWFRWLPIFETRHFLTALYGFFGVFGAFKLAVRLFNKPVGLLTAALLLLHPIYLSHLFINPKDLPFATGYIWSLYFITKVYDAWPILPTKTLALAALAFGATIGVRVGGVILFGYLGLTAVLWLIHNRLSDNRDALRSVVSSSFCIIFASYFIMVLFWPWALEDPLKHPFEALAVQHKFHWNGDVLFRGEHTPANQLPWYYLIVQLVLQNTEFFLLGLLVGVPVIVANYSVLSVLLMVAGLFPVFYASYSGAVLYDGYRHLLFVIPPLAIMSARGLWSLASFLSQQWQGWFWALAFVPYLFLIAYLHPHQGVYYNLLAGSPTSVFANYETEYWGNAYREGVGILETFLDQKDSRRVTISNCGPPHSVRYFVEEPMIYTDDIKDADYYLAFPRQNCQKGVAGQLIGQVTRLGMPLVKIFQLSKKTGD